MIKIGLFGAGGHLLKLFETIKSEVKCEIDIYDDKKKNTKLEKKRLKVRTFKDLVENKNYTVKFYIYRG